MYSWVWESIQYVNKCVYIYTVYVYIYASLSLSLYIYNRMPTSAQEMTTHLWLLPFWIFLGAPVVQTEKPNWSAIRAIACNTPTLCDHKLAFCAE